MTLVLLMSNSRNIGLVMSPAKSAGRKRETPAAMDASMRLICSGSLNGCKVSQMYISRSDRSIQAYIPTPQTTTALLPRRAGTRESCER